MKNEKLRKKIAKIPSGLPKDDLERYIAKRKTRDPHLARNFEAGYRTFFLGALLQAEREKAGVTQAELARRIGTTKTAISRLENSGRDVRFSTLERIAKAFGKVVKIELKAA